MLTHIRVYKEVGVTYSNMFEITYALISYNKILDIKHPFAKLRVILSLHTKSGHHAKHII